MEEYPRTGQEKPSAAKKRWKILSESLLKHRIGRSNAAGETNVSVRRFQGFEIFLYKKIETDNLGTWFSVGCKSLKTIQIRLLHGRVDPDVLIGFNNTGNVCIWPAEEVMTRYCMKLSNNFSGKRICEIGGGMTSLAGLALAGNVDAKLIHLTDGNQESVNNIKDILERNRNQFVTEIVTSGQLIWGSSNQTGSNEKYDFVLCADCLFFVECHQHLISTIWNMLDDEGEAIIFAPKRGNTLQSFVQKASLLFDLNVEEEYDKEISEKHKVLKSQPIYDEDIHYPLLITIKKQKK